MSFLPQLQLAPAHAGHAPTPQQKRFNTLVKQIERARLDLSAWQDGLPAYQQAYAAQVNPLHDEMAAARRQWALALDGLADAPGLSRADAALLGRLISRTAGDLLIEKRDDAELKALFARHNEVDFDTAEKQQLQETMAMMQEVTGVDIGDTADIGSEDDLAERLREKMQEAQAAEREQRAAGRRAGHAQKKREAEAQESLQSIREIFRKLASALHPDRETDPARHEAKTVLMQKVNQAYAAGDLLALLQLQVEIEQANAAEIAGGGEEKLRRYNKVLSEQLGQLKQEIHRVEAGFCYDAGLSPGARVNPAKLNELIRGIKLQLGDDLLELREELRMLADPPGAKRWLKHWLRSYRGAA
jgi:hypothetical protein